MHALALHEGEAAAIAGLGLYSLMMFLVERIQVVRSLMQRVDARVRLQAVGVGTSHYARFAADALSGVIQHPDGIARRFGNMLLRRADDCAANGARAAPPIAPDLEQIAPGQ